jgi:hypothetical protein
MSRRDFKRNNNNFIINNAPLNKKVFIRKKPKDFSKEQKKEFKFTARYKTDANKSMIKQKLSNDKNKSIINSILNRLDENTIHSVFFLVKSFIIFVDMEKAIEAILEKVQNEKKFLGVYSKFVMMIYKYFEKSYEENTFIKVFLDKCEKIFKGHENKESSVNENEEIDQERVEKRKNMEINFTLFLIELYKINLIPYEIIQNAEETLIPFCDQNCDLCAKKLCELLSVVEIDDPLKKKIEEWLEKKYFNGAVQFKLKDFISPPNVNEKINIQQSDTNEEIKIKTEWIEVNYKKKTKSTITNVPKKTYEEETSERIIKDFIEDEDNNNYIEDIMNEIEDEVGIDDEESIKSIKEILKFIHQKKKNNERVKRLIKEYIKKGIVSEDDF